MNFLILLAFLQVVPLLNAEHVHRSLREAVIGSKIPHHDRGLSDSQFTRKRRCLGTIIPLLWPQVVGPVDDGIIAEKNFEEIPKTLLEYRLDRIRRKATAEEISRLAVREYMQRNLMNFNHFDFPDFHSSRLGFVDLFHRVPESFIPDHPDVHFSLP